MHSLPIHITRYFRPSTWSTGRRLRHLLKIIRGDKKAIRQITEKIGRIQINKRRQELFPLRGAGMICGYLITTWGFNSIRWRGTTAEPISKPQTRTLVPVFDSSDTSRTGEYAHWDDMFTTRQGHKTITEKRLVPRLGTAASRRVLTWGSLSTQP